MAAGAADASPPPVIGGRRDRDQYQKWGRRSVIVRRKDGSTEVVNAARRERRKIGISGRQARIARKLARRAIDAPAVEV